MDQKTRRLMRIHKALHSGDDIDKLYKSRKEGGRGLTSIQDSDDAWIQRYRDYIKRHCDRLTTATRNNTDITNINRAKITGK